MKKEHSKFLDLLSGYEIRPEHRNSNSEPITGKTFFSRSFSGTLTGKMGLSSNRFLRLLKGFVARFLYTSTRVYGIMLLTFGALATVIDLTLAYFGSASHSYTALVVGLILSLLGIVLTFSDSPIGEAVENFFLTDYLLFEFFCIKRMQKYEEDKKPKGFAPYFGIILGTALAALSVLFHPGLITLVLSLILFVVISFASPEFSFLFTILFLPYAAFLESSITILAALLLTTTLSFLRKVISGKRVYVFEQYDLLIGAMIIFVLISGIFIKGIESFENSLMLLLGALGYVMTSNLVTNRRLADRFSTAVILSSLPAALYAVVNYAVGAVDGNYVYGGDGFYSAPIFGAFLIIAIFFTAVEVKEAKHSAEQSLFLLVLFVQLAALLCTAVFTAVIAIAFGIAAYFIFKLHRFSWFFILVLAALAYAPLLMNSYIPKNDVDALLLGTEPSSLLHLWRSSFDIFIKHPFIGIGMGAESFTEEISKYGISSATNSSNIFLEIACEAGIFALVFFVLVLLTRLRHRERYRKYLRSSQVRTTSDVSVITTFTLIVYGTTNYIWTNSSICYLFWCVFGLGSAALRISKRENDNKIIYYNDVVSPESSDIDVQIDGFMQRTK